MTNTTAEELRRLNPDYSTLTTIPIGTKIHIPKGSREPSKEPFIHTTSPSVTGTVNDDLAKQQAEWLKANLPIVESDTWWDWIAEVIIEIIIEAALEFSGANKAIAAIKLVTAVVSGDWKGALEAGKELAEAMIPFAGKAAKAFEAVTTIVAIVEATIEGDFKKVGQIVAEKGLEAIVDKAVQKIQNQVEKWTSMDSPVIPPMPKNTEGSNVKVVVVDARLDALRTKAEQENNELLLPKKDETPKVETQKDETPPKDEAPKDEKAKKISYEERIHLLKENENYLSADDKIKLANLTDKGVVDGKVGDTESEFLRLEAAVVKRKKAETNINDVIAETKAIHNLDKKTPTSKFILTEDEAIEVGIRWVGTEHTKIDEGVYRSNVPNPDGTYNQYRMEDASLLGNHNPNVPHVHLEIIERNIQKYKTVSGVKTEEKKSKLILTNHIPIIK